MSEYQLVVLGSGPAGQRAAIAAAKMGKHVAVVERNADVGGGCLHQGTIPSKTLREAVAYLSGIRQRQVYGAAYRVKEQITINDLTFRTQRVIENEVNIVRDQLIRNRVDVVAGTASFMDAHRILVSTPDGQRILQTQKTVIAVGTTPGRPAGIEFDDRRIIDSDGLLRLQELPRSMTFVGAGVVGLEYATIFQVLGVQVTLVDGRRRPLDFVDDEIEDALYYHMRDEGITLRFGEKVSGVRPTDNGRVLVELESGKTFTTDSLMFSAGRQGASADLNLESIGIHPDARGRLKVDQYFRTEIEDVYAAGDIIGFPSLASTSMEQGRLAALHAFGADAAPLPPNLPYGMYTIPEIAMTGPTERLLTEQSVPYEVGIAPFRELSRVQISGGRSGILKLLFDRHTLKLLAVHIIGQNATELVHIGQTLIDHDGTVTYLRDAVFNYPTLAEAYKVAALNGLNRL
ncbi:MAG TPA: Si-specific NAD(P)(+) transhydrogenase [bacterium]|nr:Si-specific NAD(P)(+) transhydrogenase [bacterium]